MQRGVVGIWVTAVVACGNPVKSVQDGDVPVPGDGSHEEHSDAGMDAPPLIPDGPLDAIFVDGALDTMVLDGPSVVADGPETVTDAVVDTAPPTDTAPPPDTMLPEVPPSYGCDPAVPGTVMLHTNASPATFLVHDVFGHLVSRTQVTTPGAVTLAIPGCGSVTGIHNSLRHTITYLSDGAVLTTWGTPAASPLQGPAKIVIDSAPPGATAARVYPSLAGGDLQSSNPLTYGIYWNAAAVAPSAGVTLVVHPRDNTGEFATTFALLEDVSLADAVSSPLHVTTWTTAAAAYTLLARFPRALTFFAMVNPWLEGRRYTTVTTSAAGILDEHERAVTLPDYGSGIEVYSMMDDGACGRDFMEVVPRPSDGVVELDHRADLLPSITSLSRTSPTTYSWNTVAADTEPDVAVLVLNGSTIWRIAVPPGIASYTLPELPADLQQTYTSGSLTLLESSLYAGYAEGRVNFMYALQGRRALPMGGRTQMVRLDASF